MSTTPSTATFGYIYPETFGYQRRPTGRMFEAAAGQQA